MSMTTESLDKIMREQKTGLVKRKRSLEEMDEDSRYEDEIEMTPQRTRAGRRECLPACLPLSE